MNRDTIEKLRNRIYYIIGGMSSLNASGRAPSRSNGNSSVVAPAVISVILLILGGLYLIGDVSSRSYIVPGQGTIGAVGNIFEAAGSALDIMGVVFSLIVVTVLLFALKSNRGKSQLKKKYAGHLNITAATRLLDELTTDEKAALDTVLAPYTSNYCKGLARYVEDYQREGAHDATLVNPLFDDVSTELLKTLDYIAKNTK